MSRARRQQAGQILVLVSLLFAVLAGFLGLVIDGGGVAAEQQLVRNAADGAALAGGYAVFRQGATTAAATTAAQKAVLADGLPGPDLAMAYLDAGGVATTTTALVRTIRATVTDTRATMFLNLLGVPSTQVVAVAQAASVPSACALCAMSTAATGITLGTNARLTVSGAPLIVNSTASPNLTVGNNGAVSAPAVLQVGGPPTGSGTITPAPVSGGPAADPHAAAPAPSVAGAPAAYTAPAGSPSIGPGVYSQIAVGTGASLTLTPGVYVLTGPVHLSGSGSISGTGVMVYLACGTYPTPCAVGGSGAFLDLTGGSLTLSPPTSGPYAGMAVFADRNNGATDLFSRAAVSVTGTWYTIRMPLNNTHPGDTLNLGETDAATVTLSPSTSMTVAYLASQSYGSGALSLSL